MLLRLATDAYVAQSVSEFGCQPKGWRRRLRVQIPVEVKNFYLSACIESRDMVVRPPSVRPTYQFDFPDNLISHKFKATLAICGKKLALRLNKGGLLGSHECIS